MGTHDEIYKEYQAEKRMNDSKASKRMPVNRNRENALLVDMCKAGCREREAAAKAKIDAERGNSLNGAIAALFKPQEQPIEHQMSYKTPLMRAVEELGKQQEQKTKKPPMVDNPFLQINKAY